jgi:hypothetical protein
VFSESISPDALPVALMAQVELVPASPELSDVFPDPWLDKSDVLVPVSPELSDVFPDPWLGKSDELVPASPE